MDTFTAAAKAVLIEAEAAGINACSTLCGIALRNRRSINACSTLRGTANVLSEDINACSTLWGKNFQGLKPQILTQLDAALKGRSSTMQAANIEVR
ncbi:MAG: hypothetical protein WA672_12925 [Candidatus Angelobacter sp.]